MLKDNILQGSLLGLRSPIHIEFPHGRILPTHLSWRQPIVVQALGLFPLAFRRRILPRYGRPKIHYLFFKNGGFTPSIFLWAIGDNYFRIAGGFGNSGRREVHSDWAAELKLMGATLHPKGGLYEYGRTGNGNRG